MQVASIAPSFCTESMVLSGPMTTVFLGHRRTPNPRFSKCHHELQPRDPSLAPRWELMGALEA